MWDSRAEYLHDPSFSHVEQTPQHRNVFDNMAKTLARQHVFLAAIKVSNEIGSKCTLCWPARKSGRDQPEHRRRQAVRLTLHQVKHACPPCRPEAASSLPVTSSTAKD